VQNICNCAVHNCFLAFNREIEENCALLGYYTASSSLHNNPEECNSHLLHGRSLKTRKKIEDKSIKVHEYIKKMTLSKNFLSACVQQS
jgi:hypothetical protein